MALLFTKQGFSDSFKELLGFVDADISFRRMKSYLELATDEIIDLVGVDVYNGVEQEQEKTELKVMLMQIIALRGYMLYAPTADLAVTNNGRLMRRDEHSVSAFEWQIEANDNALESLYYKQLDRLLKFLYKSNISINLKKYNHQDLLVSNLDVFEEFFNIGGSYYLYLKLIPALREFERDKWLPRSRSLSEGELSTELKTLVQSAAVSYAMSWGLRRLSVQLFPKGVLQFSSSNVKGGRNAGIKLEYLESAMLFEKDCEEKLLKIESAVKSVKKGNTEGKEIDIFSDLGFSAKDGFVDL